MNACVFFLSFCLSVCLSVCLFLEGDGYLKGFFEKTANLSPAERADFLGDYEVWCSERVEKCWRRRRGGEILS